MEPAKLLDALDPEQRRVAQQVTGPLVVRAGAGTGKTRAITYKIAYAVASGVYDTHDVLAVTFTTRAASEMSARLRALGVPGVQARTFHSAALRQLRYFWPTAVGGPPPNLVDHKAPLVAAAASRLGLRADKTTVRDLASEIEWAKVSLVSPSDYVQTVTELGRDMPAELTPEQTARLLTVYQNVKSERGVIDFEDVLLLTVGMLAERGDIAAKVRAQYKHFVVDEYQDVSPLQQELLNQWVGSRNNLCVVGDVAQTIYSFTGATSKYLVDFPKRFPGAGEVELVRNYRSSPQVVSLANRIVRNMGRGTSKLQGAVQLQTQREMGKAVQYHVYSDDEAEARAVVQQIIKLRDSGVNLADQAILYRINAQSQAFEQALSEAGIGYLVRGAEKYFNRQEIRKAMVLIRSMAKAGSPIPLTQAVADAASSVGWTASPPAGTGAVRERWDALDALVKLGEDRAEKGLSLRDFAAELEERAASANAPQINGVTLSSVHAAKGLEWDAVFFVGVSEGLFPISQAQTPRQIAEEQRLAYVAVTRARDHLHVSYAKARSEGRRSTRKPSRFFDGIWPREVSRTPALSKATGRAAAKEFEEEASPEEKELFEKLRTWRAAVAKGISKPAFTVLTDVTLRDTATVRPATVKQLSLIRGIGRVKLDLYGAAILAVVRGEDPARMAKKTLANFTDLAAD